MTQKEADSLAYEIIGLASGLLMGAWGYIDMAGTIKNLSGISPKVLESLDLMADNPNDRQVLIDCGVNIPPQAD